jgi:hypothetical protein
MCWRATLLQKARHDQFSLFQFKLSQSHCPRPSPLARYALAIRFCFLTRETSLSMLTIALAIEDTNVKNSAKTLLRSIPQTQKLCINVRTV